MADSKAALESRRDELNRNLNMVSEVLSEPELSELFLDQDGSSSADAASTMREMRTRLKTQLAALEDSLAFIGTPQQEEIELRILEIQVEKKDAEVTRRERDSQLLMPFDGDFTYLVEIPEDPAVPLNLQSGEDVAELRHYGQLECHMTVSRPEFRQLPTRNLSLRFDYLSASFLRKETREVFGKNELIYVFQFPADQAERARSLIGGRTNADLVVTLSTEAILVPKLDLISASEETFRDNGWRKGVSTLLPGHRAISVGQSHVAIIRPTSPSK